MIRYGNTMKRLMKKEITILILFVAIFISIRSIHFSSHLNFSTDQASFSTTALELWRNKKITLIGPSISYHYIGRDLYQGSITYYFQLVFLLLGKFDPVVSSYFFMVFASLMIFPLYFGAKFLAGKRVAIFMIILYALLPFYIDYTRFFWNPNFQFVLSPILILFMGLYARSKKPLLYVLIFVTSGVLLLFHYQFIFIIVGLVIYYLFKKFSAKYFALSIGGILIGFSPIITFEIRNHWYNLQTLILFIKNFKKTPSSLNLHYFLSISLFGILMLLWVARKKISTRLLITITIILFVVDLFMYAPSPAHGFGMAADWNYPSEKKVNDIIRQENRINYNIANLAYNAVSAVQKYLLKKDGVVIDFDDYYHNKYLFVVSREENFMTDPAYEINTFVPSKRLKKWKINETYSLYLLERLP